MNENDRISPLGEPSTVASTPATGVARRDTPDKVNETSTEGELSDVSGAGVGAREAATSPGETPRGEAKPAGDPSTIGSPDSAPLSPDGASAHRHSSPELQVPWFRPRGTSVRETRTIDRRLGKALLLQGVVAGVVLGYWALGKAAWNHDPLASQKFRPAELSVLTNRPQNAALQFHHDLVTGQFGQARMLAAEAAEGIVTDAEQRCGAGEGGCPSKTRVFTRATLLRSLGQDAKVHVQAFTAGDVLVSEATYDLSRASGQWLVTGHSASVEAE